MMVRPEMAKVYLNGMLMAQGNGEDYEVVGKRGDEPVIEWLPGGMGDPLDPNDTIEIQYIHDPEPSAVDQLADVILSPEDRERRKRRRTMERFMQQPVKLGISPRGIKPR